jgi:hypothetical protein
MNDLILEVQNGRLPRVPGKKVRAPDLIWNTDLIYFDGPLLSLYKKDDGQDYFVSWIDCDDYKHRWAVFPVEREILRLYLKGEVTLRNVCLEANNVVLFDTGKDAKRRNFVEVDSFPKDYLPKKTSFLKPEISTEAAKKLVEDQAIDMSLGINGELYLEDLELIPKLYQQLYSFHYGVEHLDRPAVRDSVQRSMHNWKGGFGAVNLFSGLKTVTPSIHRARLKELRYNSPGIIRLNLLPSLADKIKLAMQNILPAKIYDDAERLYKEIYSYFREHKITGFDDERSDVQLELTELQKRDLDFFARKFLKILSWERHHKALQELGVTEISRLRMLLAYYRRLRRLRDFVVNGKLSLEGEFKIGE